MVGMPSLDRQRGTLLGLAIGDALDAAVEFKLPGSFPKVTRYRGGGPHGLAPGEWTGDSSMALALAASGAGTARLRDTARPIAKIPAANTGKPATIWRTPERGKNDSRNIRPTPFQDTQFRK